MDLVSGSYRAVFSAKQRRGKAGGAIGTVPPRRREIISKLTRMESRLRSLELSLTDASPLDRREQPADADPALPEGLSRALADPDPGVRCLALRTVGSLSGGRATAIVVEALHDPDPAVRRAAAAAAMEQGAQAAVFSLILSLDDPDLGVRRAARDAIEAITGGPVDFDPAASVAARQKRLEALKAWWKEERFADLAADVQTALRP